VGKKFNLLSIVVIVFAVLLITMTAIHLTEMGSEFPNPVGNALNRILSPVEEVVWKIGDGIKKNARAISRHENFRVADISQYLPRRPTSL